MNPIIIVLRNELRLEDNPLFIYAVSTKKPIIPVWLNCDQKLGSATKLWLRESLKSLKTELEAQGLDLILRENNQDLVKLIKETKADEILVAKSFTSDQVDKELEDNLSRTIKVTKINASTLFNPDSIRNKSGGVFKVFTPFYKHCLTLIEDEIENNYEKQLSKKIKLNNSFDLSRLKNINPEELNLDLNNNSNWQEKMLKHWQPGTQGAKKELKRFLKEAITEYPRMRDFPATKFTSKLSSYLHFGEISPFRIWFEVEKAKESGEPGYNAYLRQLAWREFAIYILYHFPHSAEKNLDSKFDKFPWIKDTESLKLWQEGLTGYPIVDAGMRELWETGWMHNRVRMIVGSFLVKDLLIHWTEGAAWFWDTLFDADLANNSMGWQWVAGSGVDASPYFRIFNPTLQSEKFDKEGEYIKKWCPELSKLDSKWIHKPYEAPPLVLEDAGITLGTDYPYPVVNHKEARDRALSALKATKGHFDPSTSSG